MAAVPTSPALPSASWSFVDVRVPPGALGLIVSKSADPTRGHVVVDGFRPVGAHGETGALQRNGQITRGSILLGVNEYDFTDPTAALSFDKIREILISTSGLERIVRFHVPPPPTPVPAPVPVVAPTASFSTPIANITTTRFGDVYLMGKELGSGTFSVVREATHRGTGAKFAIKCIKRDELSKDDLEALMLEVAILKQMQHPHIVKLFDVFQEEKYYYLVTEFMAGGELFDRIVEKNFYSEREARDLVKILLESIQYMHSADVVHRDLKPENLLLTNKEDVADIKLADFGFAKKVQMDDKGLATACGTPGYVAPEILQARPYGKEVDIWSIGVITYILLCGYPPFHDDNQGVLFRKIKTGRFEFDSPYWDNVSTEAKDLISKMLVLNPADRWTATQLLDHTWITGANVNTVQLTGALIELRKFNARRKFKAAVSTVKATISLTKKLTLLGLSNTGSSSGAEGEASDTSVVGDATVAVPTPPASSHTNTTTALPAPSILFVRFVRSAVWKLKSSSIVSLLLLSYRHRTARQQSEALCHATRSAWGERHTDTHKQKTNQKQAAAAGEREKHKVEVKMFSLFSRNISELNGSTAGADTGDSRPGELVGGMNISDWDVVQVVVPPGPLGILLDGNCSTAVVLDEFAVLPDGRKGAVELHGGITRGSVLVRVNEVDFLASEMTLVEAGSVLRDASHLERTLTFKVPPPPKAECSKNTEKQTLLGGTTTTSSSINVMDDEPSVVSSSSRGSIVSILRKPSPQENALTAVTVSGPRLEPPGKHVGGKFVSVDVPPGPMGLNLDGSVVDHGVVLGFTPLPDGSKGTLETHGGVKVGSVLIEINGENVSKVPLDAVRAKLGALAGAQRHLLFRVPSSSPSTSKRQSHSLSPTSSKPRVAPIVKVHVEEDLEKRRKLELALVMKFDKRQIKRKECWFFVDAQWMNRWVAFVGRGGPLPGPITNEVLLQPEWRDRMNGDFPGEPDTPRPGLERMRDYRCVNPMVWCILCELHGPGEAPLIVRYLLDINAEVVDTEGVSAILHDPQPTAAALVQELLGRCRVETIVE